MQVILAIIIPVLFFFRIKKNAVGAIANPLFYLLAFSYLYLLLPNFYISYAIYDVYNLSFSQSSFELSQHICRWFVTVFLVYYALSKDPVISITDKRPYKGVYQLSFLVYLLLTLLFIWIVLKEIPPIFALRGNRTEALGFYHANVQSRYKLSILLYVMMGVSTVIIWYHRKLWPLLPFILICIMDFSHGGRTLTFMVFVYSYILIVLLKKKLYFKHALAAILFMILVGLFQRSEFTTWWWSLYMAGVEFSNTRITTTYVLEAPVHGSFFEHMAITTLKILPGGISNKVFGIPDGMWYGEELSGHIDLGFGLAGNIATEAIFYGGIPFAIISPIIIGGIYFLINYLKLIRTLPGLIFLVLLCAKTQDIMRMYFYENFTYILQMLIFFLPFITFIEYRKRIINTHVLPNSRL